MIQTMEQRIREEARKLLESGDVTLVIGWEAGSAPFKTTPVFIESPEDVDRLVWNPACTNNLAVYLPELAKHAKVGIVAKPCDTRSIVTLIQEKQVARENVRVIGLACAGVVDDAALSNAGLRLSEVRALDWDGENLKVSTDSAAKSIPLSEAVKEGCRACEQHMPVISDVTVGESNQQSAVSDQQSLCSFDDRRAYWAEQFDRCIRCYACRQVCPSCYCSLCFADRNDLKWTNKRMVASEAWMWHMGRAMHLAGRCIGCGECERACPMGLPIMRLNREVARHVEELFGYIPGMDLEEAPVLGRFDPEDKDPNEH